MLLSLPVPSRNTSFYFPEVCLSNQCWSLPHFSLQIFYALGDFFAHFNETVHIATLFYSCNFFSFLHITNLLKLGVQNEKFRFAASEKESKTFRFESEKNAF